ncbi:hypothetical protein CEUSTIGMA_g1380.t1 [Chlamydomonas eustigma]|uniref:FAD dependent oxidoreductase domain-containing protein n=1 Tax=Chlamydomonas eustigma TaxID=1157962 RepID=A0A250WTQ6_9CHLO|nr:hypothetical protein CEUSTIGMA_g1380.t1 [Chlamydomonas eustigma]|eukprot:GAX73930.1 hypothetical protein CEUSTIGMA_g1380.t1 [Chlamydomonas eustigma]
MQLLKVRVHTSRGISGHYKNHFESRHQDRLSSIKAMDQEPIGVQGSKRIVVIGGGIIGSSIAYYLSERGAKVTVLERECLAAAASGRAGGFLALDWNESTPLRHMSHLSYRLHQELSLKFGPEHIGYRPVHTYQVSGVETSAVKSPLKLRHRAERGPEGALPPWVDGDMRFVEVIGSTSSTAQVHPRLLTEALMGCAVSRGSSMLIGTACGLLQSADKRIMGVLVEDQDPVHADAVVIAMGPWTSQVSSWIPGLQVGNNIGQKYHSVVLRPQQLVSEHCLFTSFKYASGRIVQPELYPRPDGSVYVCGEPQSLPVPSSPQEVRLDPSLSQNLRSAAASMSSVLAAADVEAEQSCYLPLSPVSDGLPMVGQVEEIPGLYVASGHSCWGILHGPATGLMMSELLLDGEVKCLPAECSAALCPSRTL